MILRCIGARASATPDFRKRGRCSRSSVGSLGIPLGYLIERRAARARAVEVEVVVVYPLARGGRACNVVLALVVIRLPLRRAVRFRPGDALRYA